ncbi:hypothetical protein BD779DRAFT_1501043 [Infundibulicybe gibba]|nr:hypothetical protein BD779DRAFT_1501043 [Infundibulicybe gibba]
MPPSFSPSPAETALVNQIFVQGDPAKIGIVTGEVAVKLFGGAKLPPTVLGEIWSIADEDNKGWLSKKGVSVAVRLMGWAQKGEKVSADLLNKPGPLPTIDGVTLISQQNTGMSLPKSPPPGFPPLTPQERTKYLEIFMSSGPSNGLVSGDKAREIFLKSKLPNDKLLQIWNLADSQDRGALDSTDFIIAMYFINGLMSGKLSFIPTSLPPGLFQQASGSAAPQGSVISHMSGNSGSFSPLNTSFPPKRGQVQPQYTGQSHHLQPDHTGLPSARPKAPHLPARPNSAAFGSAAFAPPQWDVTQAEKASADGFFDKLDAQKRGYIEGDVAVPFMLESKLPGEDLALIWDLADIHSDGRLTRDGFAVAMHLIQKKLAGVDVPRTLPPSLIPPSLRSNNVPAPPPEPVKDLFPWDDTPPASASSGAPPVGTTFGAMQSQPTGHTSAYSSPASAQTRAVDPFSSNAFEIDLLGDDTDIGTKSPPLQDKSAEIGNTQNQLNSTNRSLEAVKEERANLEQLSALQTQLSSAKAAYETETKLLTTFKERHANQTAEIQKTREELIRAESDLSAVRVEKAEVEGAFLRDKEEARDLHRRMVETGQQTEQVKVEVEKAKRDAKQQRGLLAIAKKQLATKENEKAKAEQELAEAQAELSTITTEHEEVEAKLAGDPVEPPSDLQHTASPDLVFAASYALPVSPDPSSPPAGSVKSNNPFDRLAFGSSTPRSQSPFQPFAPSVSEHSNGTTTAVQDNSAAFNFAQAFGAGDRSQTGTPLASESISDPDATTPKLPPASITVPSTSSPDLEDFTTPTSQPEADLFSTPPTTATFSTSRPDSPTGITSRFPPIEEANSSGRKDDAATALDESHQTDLNAQLKEVEAEESDSEDEDEIPLAQLASAKAEHAEVTPTTNGSAKSSEISNVSFDDIFGTTPTEASAPSPHQPTNPTDVLGITSTPGVESVNRQPDLFSAATATKPAVAAAAEGGDAGDAGVSAFDEAMGKIPTTAPATSSAFSFDSAFEDNFDFASASEAAFPPPSNSNGMPPSWRNRSKIFSYLRKKLPLPSRHKNCQMPRTAPPSSGSRSFSPPPRGKSPPPRVLSPKPRGSTSSREEKTKEAPPPRHSKLSIRLPFGKKKKHSEPLPPPPSNLLSPPQEEPRMGSPAVDDDIEAVKQITGMGFSRSQAVAALEKHGYNMQRALDSLVGQ